MALVPYDSTNKQLTTALAGLALQGLTNTSIVKSAARLARQGYDYLSQKKPNQAKSSVQRKLMGRKKQGIASKPTPRKQMVARGIQGQVRSAVASYAVSNPRRRRLGTIDSDQNGVKVHFRGDIKITTGTSISVPMNCLGNPAASNINDLANVVPQLKAMGGLYREFRITKMRAAFVPNVGYTTVGAVAMGIDRDPRSVRQDVDTALIAIPHLNPFFLTDVKEPATLTWVPQDMEDRRWRYTIAGTPARDVEFTSHGNLFYAVTSTGGAEVTAGQLFVEVWAEYRVPF